MLRILLAISASVIVASSASASEWWMIDWAGRKPNRVIFFADKESIRPSGSRVRVWVTHFHETPKSGSKYLKVYEEFDCEAGTSGDIQTLGYSAAGEVVSRDTSNRYPTHEAVVPDSLGETLFKFVCGQKTDAFQVNSEKTLIAEAKRFLDFVDSPSGK